MNDHAKTPSDLDQAELFEIIVESSTDFAIFTMDTEGIVTSWNVGAERVFGYSQEEIIGSTADLIFTPEAQAEGVPAQERGMAQAEGRAEDERWHQRKDGSQLWGSGLMMPLRREAQGFLKIVRDGTERRLINERVRESEERFRLLATSIPQLVFRTHWDGGRTWPSPQWIEFTGLGFDKSLGFGWLDAIHPDDRIPTREAWQGAPEAGEYYMEHRVWRASDGTYRWHQTRAKPLDPADPTVADWVGTMTDIDDLRGLQDEQQVLMGELQHRTRNLLSVVQAVAGQTLRNSSSLEIFGAEFKDRLRSLSRVQALLSRTDPHPIDLRSLVEAELAAHGYRDADGKVEIAGPPAGLPAAAAQPISLALHELATNAVKHGALRQPGGKLSVGWTIGNGATQQTVELCWRESGVSMPEGGPSRHKGYGSELIERGLPYQLRAKTELSFEPDGVRCVVEVPLRGGDAKQS